MNATGKKICGVQVTANAKTGTGSPRALEIKPGQTREISFPDIEKADVLLAGCDSHDATPIAQKTLVPGERWRVVGVRTELERAVSAWERFDFAETEKHLIAATKTRDAATAHLYLAYLYSDQGKLRKSLEQNQLAFKASRTPNASESISEEFAWQQQAHLLRLLGRSAEARDAERLAAQYLQSAGASDPVLAAQYALRLMRAGDVAEGRARMLDALKNGAADTAIDALPLMAEIVAVDTQWDLALALLDRVWSKASPGEAQPETAAPVDPKGTLVGDAGAPAPGDQRGTPVGDAGAPPPAPPGRQPMKTVGTSEGASLAPVSIELGRLTLMATLIGRPRGGSPSTPLPPRLSALLHEVVRPPGLAIANVSPGAEGSLFGAEDARALLASGELSAILSLAALAKLERVRQSELRDSVSWRGDPAARIEWAFYVRTQQEGSFLAGLCETIRDAPATRIRGLTEEVQLAQDLLAEQPDRSGPYDLVCRTSGNGH